MHKISALAAAGALALLPATAAAKGPTVSTLPADPTLLTDTYALISGVVNPAGIAMSYQFEWGRTTSYGNFTPLTQAGNGKADVPVDFSLDGLKPNTTYHYQLLAKPTTERGDLAYLGTLSGGDETFKTAPALGVRILGSRARVTGGRASIRLRAVGPVDETADGRLTLSARRGRHVLTIGSAAYHIDTGAAKTLAVRLTAAGRAALKAAGGRLHAFASAKTSTVRKPARRALTLVGA